ncbi:helix-turn-helix transcriptional regulator [Actinomyces urogenitalis]|uniref:helix-turn-helix transcriptional regulator n=1 Tax=Actinomyces urogenitalis TaxID=103621 RepID=UPI00242D7C00|nr:helix-turn-helix domain-containing protein [Actinomyces urogenitalis]MCI7457616.1 helix-turn-helix domain-containing protein [Actinomyces urogenitalis]
MEAPLMLLTTEQVAQMLGVSPKTLRNWRCECRGPAFVVLNERQVRYRVEDVTAWVNSRLVPTV